MNKCRTSVWLNKILLLLIVKYFPIVLTGVTEKITQNSFNLGYEKAICHYTAFSAAAILQAW